jgi:hypothetical protein
MTYHWINLFDYMAMSKEDIIALKDSLSAQGIKLAISVDNSAPSDATLGAEYQKDLNEEAEAQGVPVSDSRSGFQNVADLLSMRRQS